MAQVNTLANLLFIAGRGDPRSEAFASATWHGWSLKNQTELEDFLQTSMLRTLAMGRWVDWRTTPAWGWPKILTRCQVSAMRCQSPAACKWKRMSMIAGETKPLQHHGLPTEIGSTYTGLRNSCQFNGGEEMRKVNAERHPASRQLALEVVVVCGQDQAESTVRSRRRQGWYLVLVRLFRRWGQDI